jgi:hypothetical protein
MASNTFVEIDLPEAADLADLTGIQVDLQTARRFAQILRNIFQAERPDWDLVDPLSTAILVRYSRPFVKGVRRWLGDEALRALSPAQRAKHEHLRLFRDKHIAHSVNAFEDNQPVARYWVERVREEGITTVECNHTRISGLSSADLEAVIELTAAMLAYVDENLKAEKARMLEIVRGIPVQEVLSSKRKNPRLPNMGDVGKSRKRLLTPRRSPARAKAARAPRRER